MLRRAVQFAAPAGRARDRYHGTSAVDPPSRSAIVSDAGSVIERIETAVGEIGQTHVVFVSQFVDQRVQRMEAFDIIQLDQALARYDELTAD